MLFIWCYCWIVEQDDNRYNASRGAHLNLKRAEKARILVNKIPGTLSGNNIEHVKLISLNPILFRLFELKDN